MKPLSVIVPTASRPEFLETALQSISRQTAASEIHEVLVSENLQNRASEAICRKFPELPIRYILQDPPLSQVGHFDYLFRTARAEFVALVCDDDWWAPGHLQAALEALVKDGDAVARFSACLYLPSEVDTRGWIFRSPMLWLAAGRPSYCDLWRLRQDQGLATAWLMTPFHTSSIVVRREALLSAAPHVVRSHVYQADRTLHARLATTGRILYDPIVDTFVRWHPGALTQRLASAERESAYRECTEQIYKLSFEHGIDPVSAWHAYLSDAPEGMAEELGPVFRRALGDEKLAEYGFQKFILPGLPARALRRARRIWKRAVLRAIGSEQ